MENRIKEAVNVYKKVFKLYPDNYKQDKLSLELILKMIQILEIVEISSKLERIGKVVKMQNRVEAVKELLKSAESSLAEHFNRYEKEEVKIVLEMMMICALRDMKQNVDESEILKTKTA